MLIKQLRSVPTPTDRSGGAAVGETRLSGVGLQMLGSSGTWRIVSDDFPTCCEDVEQVLVAPKLRSDVLMQPVSAEQPVCGFLKLGTGETLGWAKSG